MDSLIDRLNRHAGEHSGTGDGPESGAFDATFVVTPLLDRLGTSIRYRAVAADGELLHDEHTLLAHDMVTGRLTLFVLCEELSGVGQLGEVGDGVFANGAGADGFRLRISLELDDELQYTWSWAPPGESLAEQTRAVIELSAT